MGAINHFSAVWEVQEGLEGRDGEDTLRTSLQIAELEYLSGQQKEAVERQRGVINSLLRLSSLPTLLVDSSSQLARWLEGLGDDKGALEVLQEAEQVVSAHLGDESEKAV